MTEFEIPGIPYPFHTVGDSAWQVADGRVAATAAPRTDIFIDPAGGAPKLDAARVIGDLPEGDFQLQCLVDAGFQNTFDAGVLLLWFDEEHWAKLCFEYAPTGEAMVVSVVNRTVSDDANAFVVDGSTVWLRVSRVGRVYAFHASTDGRVWQMVRMFALGGDGAQAQLGFEVQSPTGAGCDVEFRRIRFAPTTLGDARDGS